MLIRLFFTETVQLSREVISCFFCNLLQLTHTWLPINDYSVEEQVIFFKLFNNSSTMLPTRGW